MVPEKDSSEPLFVLENRLTPLPSAVPIYPPPEPIYKRPKYYFWLKAHIEGHMPSYLALQKGLSAFEEKDDAKLSEAKSQFIEARELLMESAEVSGYSILGGLCEVCGELDELIDEVYGRKNPFSKKRVRSSA